LRRKSDAKNDGDETKFLKDTNTHLPFVKRASNHLSSKIPCPCCSTAVTGFSPLRMLQGRESTNLFLEGRKERKKEKGKTKRRGG